KSDIRLRIGINLGDVIVEGGDIYGDGVNLAARLEAEADPGGICVSAVLAENSANKVAHRFTDMGERQLKNLPKPIRVFQWSPGARPAAESGKWSAARDKPTIAVLPFVNMSGDPEQAYFSDGMSEDIITGLSRFRTLSVMARNSAFSLRDKDLTAAEIGARLGVQYLVEGSLRRAGDRVRITAQLVEARTGNHIWAERYDRVLEDVFEVQDEVARAIIAVLPGRVQTDVADRATRKPTDNMQAYELLLKAKALRDGLNAADNARARALLERALALDPGYARVYMYLADTYVVDLWLGLADETAQGQALELARKGASLDNRDVYIQDQLGYAYLCAGLWDQAESQFDKTLSSIVNEAESMAWCGYGFLLLGDPEKAHDIVTEAMRLDPMHPPALDWILGQVLFFLGRYDDAIDHLIGEALLNSVGRAVLAGSYAMAGRLPEAQQALQMFLQGRSEELRSRGLHPDGSVTALTSGFRGMWRRPEDLEKLMKGLQQAGLKE
ncbi:MAG: adenylate/guanylate cyclase domain-containing protein, partial [Paracoccaceae bacterium]